ncbi:unnamed protein product [Strongylus vulgaris]|uniref:SCP domain-containing protein n=1 Tax=Strongylus vulgaris TaxID=40348 RepID=A0A3P7LAQ9_STRVU|nr:unnamed protein product [Strongylus vulgaris]
MNYSMVSCSKNSEYGDPRNIRKNITAEDVCEFPNKDWSDEERNAAIKYHNDLREKIANVCDEKQFPNDELSDEERNAAIKYHNDLREKIANGNANNYVGKLTSAKNMYMLKYDCNMEKKLQEVLKKGESTITFHNGYGQNIAKFPKTEFSNITSTDQVKIALESWYNPVLYYGLKNAKNTYNDARLYTFANVSPTTNERH